MTGPALFATAARHHNSLVHRFFDWYGWEALVAIGTIGLAAATFVLVIATYRAVAAARDEVAISRLEVQASSRPVIVDVPEDREAPARNIHFGLLGHDANAAASPGQIAEHVTGHTCLTAVPVRNVGPGAAVAATPHPTIRPVEGAAYQGKLNTLVLPAGDSTHLLFRTEGIDAAGGFDPRGGNYYAEVAYTDVAGEQLTRTQLFVGPDKCVRGVALYKGVSDLPYVHYGEGWD